MEKSWVEIKTIYYTYKWSKTRNSFISCYGQACVQPCPGEQGPNTPNCFLGRQMSSLLLYAFLGSFPHFICWAWCPMVWNTSLVCWGHLLQLCLLPAPCAHLASSLVRRSKGQIINICIKEGWPKYWAFRNPTSGYALTGCTTIHCHSLGLVILSSLMQQRFHLSKPWAASFSRRVLWDNLSKALLSWKATSTGFSSSTRWVTWS